MGAKGAKLTTWALLAVIFVGVAAASVAVHVGTFHELRNRTDAAASMETDRDDLAAGFGNLRDFVELRAVMTREHLLVYSDAIKSVEPFVDEPQRRVLAKVRELMAQHIVSVGRDQEAAALALSGNRAALAELIKLEGGSGHY